MKVYEVGKKRKVQNMSFLKKLGKIERIRFFVTLFLLGVFFAVVSVVVLLMPQPELLSAEGTILYIDEYEGADGEMRAQTYIAYQDSNGVAHDNVPYPAYSSSMKEGDAVTVLYDPDHPERVQSPGGKYIPYVFLAIGVVAVFGAIVSIAKGLKKSENHSPFGDSERKVDPFLAEQVRNNDEITNEYYFHWTGKLNQSYVLETPSRSAVFEAICDKIGVFSASEYTFKNHLTGYSKQHKIGKTVTTRYGSQVGNASYSVPTDSHFKIDDENIWDFLYKQGYSVELKREGIHLNFDIFYYNEPVAHLEAAGANLLSDDKQTLLGDKLTTPGIYKVWCKDSNLEAVFYICFCVSRVEFF